MEVYLHTSLISVPEGVSNQLDAPRSFIPGETASGTNLCGPQSRCGYFDDEKFLTSLLEIKPSDLKSTAHSQVATSTEIPLPYFLSKMIHLHISTCSCFCHI